MSGYTRDNGRGQADVNLIWNGGSTGCGFAIEYNKDIVGTPLELKLHRIFEAVAKTVNYKIM